MSKRDADALFVLISEKEKRASGITTENLSTYLNIYVLAGLGDLKPSDQIQIDERVTGSISASRHFRTATGSIPISFTSDTVGNDARVNSAIWSLFIARMYSELSGTPLPGGRSGMLFMIETLKRDGPALEAMGIKGIYFMGGDDEQFFTWGGYMNNREQALAKYDELMKGDRR